MPRTKIIATLGPASSNYTVLRKMFTAGLDVVRLNCSHGSHKKHLESIELIREINKKYRRHIRIMLDLEGFRIRIGRFIGSKEKFLKNRTVVWLTNDTEAHGPKTIPFDYKGDLNRIKPDQLIYIDDGNLILRVKSTSANSIKAVVVEGGILKERKGINIPDVDLEFEGITKKDKNGIEFGIKHKVDYIALSFVRHENDVRQAAELIRPGLPDCRIVAKIENKHAIKNIDQIINAADGIMVARGDMGVAVPIYEVPIIQKRIIKKCNAAGKFVITATQMLEHMTEHSRPTRAEVTDVANAIIDGTDYVMLSAETAVGLYPHQSVLMMNDIIKYTEKELPRL
ncbi:MAG: pyruvate kinase [Phycisphaerae bacterium]|nr:pyruvate kinase [Phycisphaerae bacterium]NIP53984.1 pyruvate kinase [Phycisphaerae bacterium]NIS49601.1 pyruvate kinase [Phycisphaerae bacterium]NIU08688.1 pyruvate kinase [Phycisphaerae bacterium]NIU56319.1 pyruvate kinase [Phycisphaerae bacterium]